MINLLVVFGEKRIFMDRVFEYGWAENTDNLNLLCNDLSNSHPSFLTFSP